MLATALEVLFIVVAVAGVLFALMRDRDDDAPPVAVVESREPRGAVQRVMEERKR